MRHNTVMHSLVALSLGVALPLASRPVLAAPSKADKKSDDKKSDDKKSDDKKSDDKKSDDKKSDDKKSDDKKSDDKKSDGEGPDASETGSDPSGDGAVTDETDPAAPGDTKPSTQSEADQRQRAAAKFREGSMFYELGQFGPAIAAFEQAWLLAPEPQLLFNLGQAHRRWFEVDPNIDHLRKSKTFFINYDKRLHGDPSYGRQESEYVESMIGKLTAQIELEETREAERNRVIVTGPSAQDIENLEKRRLKRQRELEMSRRLNGSGIGLIVVGSVALGVGVGGVLARTTYKAVLDNTSPDDPNAPGLATADEDARRRQGFLTAGQVGFGSLIAAAVFLPIGIGLRVSGGLMEKKALRAGAVPPPKKTKKKGKGGKRKDAKPAKPAPPPKVAIVPSPTGIIVHF